MFQGGWHWGRERGTQESLAEGGLPWTWTVRRKSQSSPKKLLLTAPGDTFLSRSAFGQNWNGRFLTNTLDSKYTIVNSALIIWSGWDLENNLVLSTSIITHTKEVSSIFLWKNRHVFIHFSIFLPVHLACPQFENILLFLSLCYTATAKARKRSCFIKLWQRNERLNLCQHIPNYSSKL